VISGVLGRAGCGTHKMLKQDPLFVSSVQSHLMALRSLLYRDKDIRLLQDHDFQRRLEFVNFEAIIPRKILRNKSRGAVQLGASQCQYDSLVKPSKIDFNGNGQLPHLSSKSGTRLLHLAYVGNTTSKSVKRCEKGSDPANRVLIPNSTTYSFDVSKSARCLITSVLDEVLRLSVDEVNRLDDCSDTKTVTPVCTLDDNAELSSSARDWTGNLINDVMQNALINSRFAVDGESSLGGRSVHLSSDDCDQDMTGSAREAVFSFVHDTVCFCVEDTLNYLDLDDNGNVTAVKPGSSCNPMQKQSGVRYGETLGVEHEQLPVIADDKRGVQVFRVSTSEKPSDSRKSFLKSVQDNLDSLRSILYRGNRFTAKKGDVIKRPVAQLELNSIIPSWIGEADRTNIRRNLEFNGQKSCNFNSGNKLFSALKSGNNGLQKYKPSTFSATRIAHNRPSNSSLTPIVYGAATVHSRTDQSRCHDSHHAMNSNEVEFINRKRTSRANAVVGSLPKVKTLAENRKFSHFNSRDRKGFLADPQLCVPP
jgi:hypothetical protein